MEVTLSVFTVVILLFAVNIILEHLLNWFVRETGNDLALLAIMVWVLKTVILVGLLAKILIK